MLIAMLSLFALNGCGGDASQARTDDASTSLQGTAGEQSVAIQLWTEGRQPVFGIFVPSSPRMVYWTTCS